MYILQLKISLLGIEPEIYRVVHLPDTTKLRNLHKVIQNVMEWGDYHLYEFVRDRQRFGPKSKDFNPPEMLNDNSVVVNDLLQKKRQKLQYIYDFGDEWVHEIRLQNILPTEDGVHYPVCIDGKHAGPPEDSGGPAGYCDLLEALDPAHRGHEEALDWLGDDYDPVYFDLDEVNRRLRRIKI
jgi:hypothetical protein